MEIDSLLTAQLIVAWAGERGEEERRLGWWRTDLLSVDGGRDLLGSLLPRTGEWAVLQAVREAARRIDEAARKEAHDSDKLISLFALGFQVEERADERLQDFKRSGKSPGEALPEAMQLIDGKWDQQAFVDWCEGHGDGNFTKTSSGRRIKGDVPSSLDRIVD
ncbi:MAG: BREX-6 system BrxE protein, partial [Planctomycetota bacterium]